MQIPYNSTQQVELTPSKLNFYLAQCSRNRSRSREQTPSSLSASRVNCQSRILSFPSRQYNQLKLDTPHNSITQRQNPLQSTPLSKQSNLYTNQSTISSNGPQHQISNLPLYHHDALDHALIQSRYSNSSRNGPQINTTRSNFYPGDNNSGDKEYYKLANSVVYNPGYQYSNSYSRAISENPVYAPNSFASNYSEVRYPRYQKQLQSYSPSSRPTENFNYFNHHDNASGMRKKVNWRTQPKKIQKKNVYYLKALEGYNQLSHQLQNITKQLKNNSKCLQSLNTACNEMVPKTRKSLRKVNFKFGDVDEYCPREEEIFRGRPRIYYEDKIYNDPKYIIWHPLYYGNSRRKFL